MSAEEDDILSELHEDGVFGSALISREGMILESDLPQRINEETFAIMCATIMGGANTANSELDRGSPKKIIIDSQEGRIIIANAGSKNILTVIVDSTHELAPLFKTINEVVKKV